MSLRPRFSNSPERFTVALSGGDTSNPHDNNDTVKDHRLTSSAPRFLNRLSISCLMLVSSLYFFFAFSSNNLLNHDHGGGLRGLLGVMHVTKSTSVRRNPSTTQQEHPRMVRYYMLDGSVDTYNNQQKETAVSIVAPSDSREETSFHNDNNRGNAIMVQVEPMSRMTTNERHDNRNDREREQIQDLADPLETRQCKAQYQWQLDSKPTCNSMHEIDLGHFLDMKKKNEHGADYSKNNSTISDNVQERVRLIAGGGWRDVWGISADHHHQVENVTAKDNNNELAVLKTLLYPKEVIPRNVERHRRDAMAMERLTSSPNIVDIYSFCGNSGIFEYANGGDLEHAIRTLANSWHTNGQLTREERLQRLHLGVQAAMGLADLHNFDLEGRPSVSHTDISLNQFVNIDGRLKLNDFNRARFLMENRKNKGVCPYRIRNNPGRGRSPEEYMYEDQTEKVDVYSFGNILYALLTLEKAFYDISTEEAQERVIQGKRPRPSSLFRDPPVVHSLWSSHDPIDLALRSAMDMCLEGNVTERATARQVEDFLKAQLEQIDPGRLEAWGVK